MSTILKISDASSIAIHTVVLLACKKDKLFSNNEIASILKVSENHLSKVLQRLAKAGMVNATRGPRGGFMLAKDPQQITILNVYEAIDGPLQPSNCLLGTPICGGKCVLGDLISSVNSQVKDYFEKKTINDLIS